MHAGPFVGEGFAVSQWKAPILMPPPTTEQTPAVAHDPLLKRAVEDWQKVFHGNSTVAFLKDLEDIRKRDSAPGQPMNQSWKDLGLLNQELKRQGLLPNMEIYGAQNGRVVVQQMSRGGRLAVLEERHGMVQVRDADPSLLRSEQSTTPKGSFDRINDTGVRQGEEIGDCRFEARLAALAMTDPKSISNMVRDNHDGTYTVTFPSDPHHPQTVDAPTPWERSTFTNGGSEWALILGKAYRHLTHQPFGPEGSARGIEGLFTGKASTKLLFTNNECNASDVAYDWVLTKFGSTPSCVSNVTGDVSQWANDYDKSYLAVDKHDLGKILEDALKNQMLITTSFKFEGTSKDDRSALTTQGDRAQLFQGHEYAVEHYDPVTKTVTLSNPWGHNVSDPGGLFLKNRKVQLSLEHFQRIILGLDVEKTSLSR
jgi:hypothetical protein